MLKKIFLLISLFFIIFSYSYWAPWQDSWIKDYIKDFWDSKYGEWWYVIVTVLEPLPWMKCLPEDQTKNICDPEKWCNSMTDVFPEGTKYKCIIPNWTQWFYEIFGTIIKFLTYFLIIIAVLALVIYWIMLSMSWVNPNFKTTVKNSLVSALIWILLLFLGWYILYLINPAVYRTFVP